MPLQAIRTVSKAQNGVGAYLLPCKKINFHYCDWAGSSRGMNRLLRSPELSAFARSNPSIEISISPRPGRHPVIKALYMNGREKAVCVRNMSPEQILNKATLLRSASGEKLKAENRAGRNVVRGLGESVRGIWDPFHGAGKAFKI